MALQSQINPHFLFNTLKTVFWKTVALTGYNNDASHMLEQLSAILQYSLSPSDAVVLLEEEIEDTKNYIQIQRVRYENRFHVIWDYDNSLLSFNVIKLMFQPFIENSIYHGCYPDGLKKCYIKIKIRQKDGKLHIAIMDNGQGIPSQQLQSILQKMEGDIPDEVAYSHIGIANTNKRLRLFYGDSAKIHIISQTGVGTCIQFAIPCQ